MKLKNIFQQFLTTLMGLALIFNLAVSSASAQLIVLDESGGTFTVPADQESGVLVTPGLSNSDYPSYEFSVEGSWQNSPSSSSYGCFGTEEVENPKMAYPTKDAFSLIADNTNEPTDERFYEVCEDPAISFLGDAEIKFVMNDAVGEYENNEGSLEVTYTRMP